MKLVSDYIKTDISEIGMLVALIGILSKKVNNLIICKSTLTLMLAITIIPQGIF